jgi:hypothetical protein
MKKKIVFLCLAATLTVNSAFAGGVKMLIVDDEISINDPWYKNNKSEEENFTRLITALKKSTSGRNILERATEKAAQQGKTLLDVISSGEGSLTDTTLVRRFSASNPKDVVYETKSRVYLNRHLKTLDAMLDLAHELTHYTYREAFNPYDSRFHLKDFIQKTVEGRGGEVDAYLVECKVLSELYPGDLENRSNCGKVLDQRTGRLSKAKGTQEFYKVGAHFSNLKKDFQKFSMKESDLPQVSSEHAMFISSAWGVPYPVAAVREYSNIMDRVCKNDQNRLSLMQNKGDRSPASETYKTMFEDYKSRCQQFTLVADN